MTNLRWSLITLLNVYMHLYNISGELNNTSARERSFSRYLLLFAMCKAGNQDNERPRAPVLAERTFGLALDGHDVGKYVKTVNKN